MYSYNIFRRYCGSESIKWTRKFVTPTLCSKKKKIEREKKSLVRQPRTPWVPRATVEGLDLTEQGYPTEDWTPGSVARDDFCLVVEIHWIVQSVTVNMIITLFIVKSKKKTTTTTNKVSVHGRCITAHTLLCNTRSRTDLWFQWFLSLLQATDFCSQPRNLFLKKRPR